MIQATTSSDGSRIIFRATVRGLPIYLDNWAIGDLAEGDPSRRKRFIAALHSGRADLMFSVTNAAELSGPLGRSFDAAKSFLNEVGPNWFPVELDVAAVVKREESGADPAECCVSQGFMKAYFENRTASLSPGSGKVIDPSEAFSGLGAVLDWVGGPHRDSVRKGAAELDGAVKSAICRDSAKYAQTQLAPLPFDGRRPAAFASYSLARIMIAESNQWREHDGLDFFHAVMAAAFASAAALDKHWKRRIEGLPDHRKLARIYYKPELDMMVADIEACVSKN